MFIANHIPLTRVLTPFVLGIVCASYFPKPMLGEVIALTCCISFLTLALLFYMNHKRFKRFMYTVLLIVACINFLLFGYGLALLQIGPFQSNHITSIPTHQPVLLTVKLVDELQEKANSYQVKAQVLSHISNDTQYNCNGTILIYLRKDSIADLNYGDELLINANLDTIESPLNPNQFDYKRYLFHHDIYHRTYLSSYQWTRLKTGKTSIWRIAYQTRRALLKQLKELGFKNQEFAVVSALLLGEKDYLSPELSRSYASAGAMHVLAVSGLHVGIIFWIVNLFLKQLPKTTWIRILRAILVSLSVWAYAFLTGLSPSVIRAATMFTAVALGGAFRQQTNIYNTLAGSAFIILAIKPFMIMQVGMQLSYLAVFGIVYFQPKFKQLYTPKPWLFRKAWEITCVSFAAQLTTAPLGLLYFHQFPNYFFISNLIVIPAAFLIVYAGVLTFSFTWLATVQVFFGKCLWWLTYILNFLVESLTTIPYALTTGIDLTTFQTWMIYCSLLSFSFFFAFRKPKWLLSFLGLCSLLMLYQVYERHVHLQHQQLTIYSVRDAYCIGIINQLEASLATTDKLKDNEDQLLFHIWHHLWNQGIESFDLVSPSYLSTDSSYQVFKFNQLVILHQLRYTEALPSLSDSSILMVSNNAFIPKSWIALHPNNQIILDGTWSSFKALKTTKWLEQQGSSCYNLKQKGAFSRSIMHQ